MCIISKILCNFFTIFLLQKDLCCVNIGNALQLLGIWRHTSQQGKRSAAERERVVSVKHEQLVDARAQ